MELGTDALFYFHAEQAVPYTSPVPKDLKPGKVICITGVIYRSCSRFSVDLVCGSSSHKKTDIALHLNPRLSQKYVVRNSRQNGHWGEEETTSIQKFPFERNKNFDLNIFIAEKAFLISSKGKHICAFVFRLPLSKITTIEIHGCVDVPSVDFREQQTYPEVVSGNIPVIAIVRDQQQPISRDGGLEVPLTLNMPGGFPESSQLEIHGRIKILPHSFYVNLQEGSQIWPHPNVHLHLNPRFSTASGEHIFVRNAWFEGGWGQEERVLLFQFTPGSPFILTISRGSDRFSVWVNSKLAGEFKFRGDTDKINTVYIQGDIFLQNIYLVQKSIDAGANNNHTA